MMKRISFGAFVFAITIGISASPSYAQERYRSPSVDVPRPPSEPYRPPPGGLGGDHVDLGGDHVDLGGDNLNLGGAGGGGGGGGGSGGDRRPMYYARVAYCVYTTDPTASCISDNESMIQLLERMYLDEALDDLTSRTFKIYAPDWVDREKMILTVRDLQVAAIRDVGQILHAQVNRLTPFQWRVEDHSAVEHWRLTQESDVQDEPIKDDSDQSDRSNHRTDLSFHLGPTYQKGLQIHADLRNFDTNCVRRKDCPGQ